MSETSNRNSAETIAAGYVGDHLTQRFTERTFNLFNDSDYLVKIAEKWKNVAKDKAQGHMFEQLEVLKFNFDALKKDSELFAKTTASMGMPTDPVDIVIKRGHETLREIQAKSCNNAARSAFALSQEKYEEMARLAPIDQNAKIEELLRKRIETGTLKAEEYEQTLRNLQESLRHGNVASSGTTYQEAIDATDIGVAEKLADKFKLKSALIDMHESGKIAGNIGATINGSITAIKDIHSLYKGEIEIGQVAANVAINSAKGYATGYVVTSMSKGITHSTSYFLGESIAKTFAKSSAPVAIAAGVVNVSKSLVAYMKGDIDADKLLDDVSNTAINSTSSFYYGVLGQAVIPIPLVGALIGAGVGYFIGNMLHQSGLIALGDSKIVKEAKNRRRTIEAMCLSLIPEIRKNRVEMEKIINIHFANRKKEFFGSLNQIDDALGEWDPDLFIGGLDRINNQFGASLQFKSFAEFDSFMKTDEAFEF